MLHMVRIMYQNTLPNKNMAKKNHLDSPKYFPTVSTGSTLTVVMLYLHSIKDRVSAHETVFLDQRYVHCRLDNYFRVNTY